MSETDSTWIDAHCHLADPHYGGDLEPVLARSRAAGVGGWIQGGVDPEDWDRQEALGARFGPAIVTAFGLHPWWVAAHGDEEADRGLESLERRLPAARGAGELGLDWLERYTPSRERQKRVFRRQLELAKGARKPLVLHVVRAHGEALDLLEALAPFPEGGLVHAFNGPLEVARRYLDLGLLISVGGALLREGFHSLKKAIPSLPGEGIVVETDAPDGVAEPADLVRVAAALAALRPGESREQVLLRSARNVRRIFP